MDKDSIARLRGKIAEAEYDRNTTASVPLEQLTALLSIAERAADVEGMVAALYEDWPMLAISPALAEATGVALNEAIPMQKVLDCGGDVNGLRKHATAVSRYVLGGE